MHLGLRFAFFFFWLYYLLERVLRSLFMLFDNQNVYFKISSFYNIL